MSLEEYCDCAECTKGCDCKDCLLCKGDDSNTFCEECQHSRSICEGDDNRDCECLRDEGGWFAESDYGDGPGA